MTLVFNASPLIVLAKAQLLDSFTLLGDPVLIPKAVVDEVSRVDDPTDPARIWIRNLSPPIRIVDSIPISPFLAAWDLGQGESAVISAAAATPDAVAVLDDLAARRCALAHGIQITGTLGLVVMAKKRGLIPTVTGALEAIVAAGLFISPRHLDIIRTQVGE